MQKKTVFAYHISIFLVPVNITDWAIDSILADSYPAWDTENTVTNQQTQVVLITEIHERNLSFTVALWALYSIYIYDGKINN